MKARDYIARYVSDASRETLDDVAREISASLVAEAKSLAKLRNYHGGAGTNTSFGTYADCFGEQWPKWLAICRGLPALDKRAFMKHLAAEEPQVCSLMARKGVFRFP